MGEPHWFAAYSHALQQVGEAAHGRKWESRREALEIKASLLVHAFWCETDIDLTMENVKHCWEPAPRTLHHQRENGPTAHVSSYLDELAVRIPTLEAWDQMVWPTMVAIPRVPTEAKSYGYCQGQVVDLGPVMPAVQFCVTEEGGTYLCTVRALVFEGNILMYNLALNEAEWVPARGLANDLSWAEERSAVALANYVPCAPVEVVWIARLRVGQVVSCPSDDSSMMSMERRELWLSDAPSTNPPTDTDREVREENEEPLGSKEGVDMQTSPGDEAETNVHTNRRWCSQNWEAIMEELEGLAYNDPIPALMLPSWGWTAHQGLNCLHVMSLQIPHLTLQGVWLLPRQGHPWSKCHRWCPKSPRQHLAWTQLRSMFSRQSWMTCKLEAHIWASPECARLQPKKLEMSILFSIYSYFVITLAMVV